MRVVILADFAVPNGGAPKVAIQSAHALAEAGNTVTYIHAIGSEGDPALNHPAIRRISLGLHDIWDLPQAKGLIAAVWNAPAARRLAALLAAEPVGATVVHLHQWTRGFSASVFPVLASCGHPFVVTLHDYFLACPNGLYYRFEKGRPCDVRPMSLACLAAPCDPKNSAVKAARVLRTALQNYGLRRVSFDVIHVSDRARDTIIRHLALAVRHHRVDNPVDISPRPPAEIAPDAAIAYIGRLTHEKGVLIAAEAAKHAGVPLVVIGEGPLEAKVRAVNPTAHLLGWRTALEVNELLQSRTRAVVAPSLWYETGPLTIYEALASGVPAIVSDRAGAAERVVDAETGLVVEPTIDALATAFRTIAEGDTAGRLGREAHRRYWSAPPTPGAHAERLVEIYREMLDSAAG